MTMFYPMAKMAKYLSLPALCSELRLDARQVQSYVANAAIEGSPLVVCEGIMLDGAADVRLILQMHEDGTVTQWVGFFAEASEEREDVLAFIAQAAPVFNTDMGVGEFSPRRFGNA